MFQAAVELVLSLEGGFTNDPADKGNWTGGEVGAGELKGTKYGISAASYPQLDIRNLTREEAIEIYKRDYWEPLTPSRLEPRLALLAFDTAVNSGLTRAQRWLRDHPTFHAYLAYRLRFYARLTTFTTYGRGWVNRMATIIEACTSAEPTRVGRFQTIVLHDLTITDRFRCFHRRPVLRGEFIASRTTSTQAQKLDVRRES